MKLFTITSEYSKAPLAEIRTDGRRLEFIVDNTAGMLPKMAQNSFQVLEHIVSQSSHLEMHEPVVPTVSLLRYILDNGDVVEVTADGKTALVNGRLLNPQEQKALFDSIKRKELKVTRRADMANAVPVMPTMHPVQEIERPGTKVEPEDMRHLDEIISKQARQEAMSSSYHDPMIEKMDFKNTSNFSPETGKRLVYLLKYGITKGEDPNA